MRTSLIALSLALLGAATAPGLAAPAAAQGYYGGASSYDAAPRARIWLDNGRDSFRRGERLRILFSTSEDAYVAVIHIDPDGNLDFLYPESPLDRDFVRGGQTVSLPRGGFSRGELVRGNGGIGYLYIIASRAPLDYGYFQGRGYGWDWSYAGRGVHGDPFWALEQITRTLLPDDGYIPYTTDYASYYVEGRPWRYPTYACGGVYRGGRVGFGVSWGYNPYYDSCDRLDIFLRRNPYYFDPVRYRGDRRVVYRDYGPWQPNHGYKATPDRPRQAVPRNSGQQPARSVAPQNGQGRAAEPAQPARRPTLERRPAEPAPAPAPRSREPETRQAAPANRGVTRATPDRAPAPERASGRSGGSSPAPAPARATGKSGGSSPAPAQPARRRPGGD